MALLSIYEQLTGHQSRWSEALGGAERFCYTSDVATRRRIAFIGAGNVGATCAHLCFLRSLGDIVLYDIIDGLSQGKALDLLESAPMLGVDVRVIGSTDIKDIVGADCVVVTSGSKCKPGMRRDDLLKINAAS